MEQEDVMLSIKRIAQTPTENDTIHIDYDSRSSRRFRDYIKALKSIGDVEVYENKRDKPLLKLEYENYSKVGTVRIHIDNGSSDSSPHINHSIKMRFEWALVSNEGDDEDMCILTVGFGTGLGSLEEACRVKLDRYMIV